MKPVSNVIRQDCRIYTYKGKIHIRLGADKPWCIMESSDLKPILDRTKLTTYHRRYGRRRYGRYPRVRWEETNEAA
jgi:hypothetical protein